MSDDVIEPLPSDPVVRTALQLLPVPDHQAGFWSQVTAALEREAPAAVSALADHRRDRPLSPADATRATVPLVELQPAPVAGVVPAAMRRPSNIVLSAVAVAAAVMVVLAGASLVRSRTGDDPATEVAEAPEGTEGDGSAAPPGQQLDPPGDDPATAAVAEWINALAAGEMEAAWAALGPASKEHWGSQADFEQQRSGFAEGYGAWSAATPDKILVTPLASSGEGELLVVTLIGTVEQEGMTVARADAFPVRLVGDSAAIELYAFAGELEIVVPEPLDDEGHRPPVGTGEELVVVVPDDAEAPVIRLDDGEPLVCGTAPGTRLTPLEGSSGQRCGYAPEGGIPAGDRVLTVAFRSADGSAVSARSVRFQAA
jgi:hypothetical protein